MSYYALTSNDPRKTMLISLDQLSPSQIYHTMTQTLIPRPIAWVLSENSQGRWNLAPFSYFTGVCSHPPLLMLSVGKKADGSLKDTWANIEQRNHFVVHIPRFEQLQAVNDSAAALPETVSEVEQLGLKVIDFPGSRLPRLDGCPIAYACECFQIQEIGHTPQALIFGKINIVYVADEVAEWADHGRLSVDANRLDPIGRLGGNAYASIGNIQQWPRPK